MIANYITTALRFLTKNRLYTLINTVGLAVSVSCALLIYLYIKQDLTYDEFHQDIERLYVIGEGTKDGSDGVAAYYQTVYPAFPAMLDEFPEIETGTRYFDWDARILISGEKKFMHQVHFVDSTFLQTLSFPLLTGDPRTALDRKDKIIISKEVALKLFNATDIIGETISLENGDQYIVSGVLSEIPDNSSVRPEVLISLMAKEDEEGFLQMGNWYNTIAQVVIKLKPGADPNELRAKLPAFVKKHYDPVAKQRILNIYPLADLRQSVAQNATYMYGLGSIAVFVLLIAVINFMNLSTAGSLKRLRETGMRKLMGSTKSSIVLQFFLEAFLLTLVSVFLSVGILQISLPLLNAALGMDLIISAQNLSDIILLSLALTVIIAAVAGGYPALYLSAYKTVSALKGIIPNYRGRLTLRNSLVVIQFVVSVTLIVSVMVTFRQINFMKTADLKFSQENVVVVNMDAGFQNEKVARARLQGIINETRSRTDVVSVSLSQTVPGRYQGNYNRFLKEDGNDGLSLRKAYVDDYYLPTYDIKILEGRNFSRDYPDSSNSVMLNAAAVKALGWTDAVGKTLRENGDTQTYTVVGVFDDFHYRSLDESVEPLIHFYFNKVEYVNLLSIRIAPNKTSDILAFLQSEWKSLDSWLGLNYFFVDEEFDAQYESIERTLLLITVFTSVAIVICCAGIFALSAIAAQQRTKEIGIRKVLGATVSSIVGLLSRDFLKLVVLSVLLAAPLSWYGMSEWLKEFEYKIPLEWWIFFIAGCIALMIAFATTGLQSVSAARNNPVDSLHND